MSLLKDYYNKSAVYVNDFTDVVVEMMDGNPLFTDIQSEVTILKSRNKVLLDAILARVLRNRPSNVAMANAKDDTVRQLDVVRKLADDICNGDVNKERETGYNMSKDGRTTRRFIAAAQINSAKPTGNKGQLEIKIKAGIVGNQGFEVHYILDGNDYIVGVSKIKSRSKSMIVDGFPSLKQIDVYLVTLSTNNLRSKASNVVTTAAV